MNPLPVHALHGRLNMQAVSFLNGQVVRGLPSPGVCSLDLLLSEECRLQTFNVGSGQSCGSSKDEIASRHQLLRHVLQELPPERPCRQPLPCRQQPQAAIVSLTQSYKKSYTWFV